MGDNLRQIELLAEQLYHSGSPDERKAAQVQLAGFSTSIAFLGDCRNILENSHSPFALLLATKSLLTLMTRFWNQFDSNQTAELSAYLITFLGNRCGDIPPFVLKSATQVLARVTKFGFLSHQHHRELCNNIDNFFQASFSHFLTGLQILTDIVDEMNRATGGQSNTVHRKVAAGFRDMHLKNTFQRAMEQCRGIVENRSPCSSNQEKNRLKQGVLELACRCLNFDFIGNMPHDAEAEAGTIQVPTTWKSVLEGTGIVELVFELMVSSSPEQAGQCGELLRLLAACRRGAFSEQGRKNHLHSLLQGASTVLANHKDLVQHGDVYHHFCRFLDQLKRNFQLKELVADTVFVGLLELIAGFTQGSFNNYQENMQGLHYLIGLWARLCQDFPYLEGVSAPQFTESFIPQLVQAIVECQTHWAVTDPSEAFDKTNLVSILDHTAPLCRFRYEISQKYFSATFEHLYVEYKNGLQALERGDQRHLQHLLEVESKLAVILYISGTCVAYMKGIHATLTEQIPLDAELSSMFFTLIPLIEARINNQMNIAKSKYLDLAVLHFLNHFRQRYLGSTALGATRAIYSRTQNVEATVYARISAVMGQQTTEEHILALTMSKCISNLKFWHDEDVIKASVVLFDALTSDYTTSRSVCALPACTELLAQHGLNHFAFLRVPTLFELHTRFYFTLARLAFRPPHLSKFDTFVAPLDHMFAFIGQQNNIRSEAVLQSLPTLCRFVTGIVEGALTIPAYLNLFDWLHPEYLSMLVRAIEAWWDQPDVAVPILSLFSELCHNKANRITFPSSSANSILLFKETSRVIHLYGACILRASDQTSDIDSDDFYQQRLQGISLCFKIMTHALQGNYVNFGVFALYNDHALSQALSTSLRLILTLPLRTAFAYPDISNQFYALLEVLFRHHIELIIENESKVFMGLVMALHEGLSGFDVANSSKCAAALDALFSSKITLARQRKPPNYLATLNNHFQGGAALILITEILGSLFNMVIFDGVPNTWSLARPILSISVCFPQCLDQYQKALSSFQQSQSAQQLLPEAFQTLMNHITPYSHDVSNQSKEQFVVGLNKFVRAVSGSCVRPLW